MQNNLSLFLLSSSIAVEYILNLHTHIAHGMKVTYMEHTTWNGVTKRAGFYTTARNHK